MANSSPPATPPPAPPLKQITFAFPFRKKGQGNGSASADFTDEHEIFRLLKQESSGSFPVSSSGMWHGGIHITEAGAGQSMDLKGGVRCIADGEVVAWRLNRAYLVNQIPAHDGQLAINASYSTGFALVKHTMEFPRGTTLTFFSLYMHLQDYAGYESDPSLAWPAYWAAKVEVTQDASDKPKPAANGQTAPDGQTGLNVRPHKGHGASLGILPQGTQVSLSQRDGNWGQIADDPDALFAPKAGAHVDPSVAKGGWIFLGKEPGRNGPDTKNVMPDSSFDAVNVVAEGKRVKVKAGEVLGYLGRFDSLRNSTTARMVHIEVFCDDTIKQFITTSSNWVAAHHEDTQENKNQWTQVGVSPEPTILRVDSGVKLYKAPPPANPAEEPNPTDVIQVCGFATLPHDPGHMVKETQAGSDGTKRTWWKVDSADQQRNPVSGWVREQSFAGGIVTTAFAQSWVDFECHDEDHDPTHTIFANTQDYVDYQTGGQQTPDSGSKTRLSPLMAALYGVLFPTGDGTHAVDELSNIGQGPQGSGFPWVAFRASRLIPKHESEWANPSKWQALITAIEQHTGPRPEHAEEKKRIDNLVWWDAVKAGVQGFPGSDVFHIHPVALVGNFFKGDTCACGCCLGKVFNRYRWVRHRHNHPPQTYYGPVYAGTKKLDKFTGWGDLIATSKATEDEKAIVIAMSSNEGNMDAVQAWDWQTFSAGSMQKTVTPEGYGELPQQISEFQNENPGLFGEIFGQCGWSIEQEEGRPRIYYSSSDTENRKITGRDLYEFIKKGFQETDSGFPKESKPLASIAHAMINGEYQKKQVVDFIGRLHNAIAKKPSGYGSPASDFFLSRLGRALVLDHDVNAPGNVSTDLGTSVDTLRARHTGLGTDPTQWGDNRSQYETELIQIYGPARNMNSAVERYNQLRGLL